MKVVKEFFERSGVFEVALLGFRNWLKHYIDPLGNAEGDASTGAYNRPGFQRSFVDFIHKIKVAEAVVFPCFFLLCSDVNRVGLAYCTCIWIWFFVVVTQWTEITWTEF